MEIGINKFIAAANENDRRRANLFTDVDFHDAVATTINNIESITNTTLNQRCKYKRLHLRHTALTMCTKDFSQLLLMKPGELRDPEYTIMDPCSHQSRPCRTIDETQQSTKKRTKFYMDPPAVEKQCLFGAVTADKVGPSGFAIDRNYIVSDETMKACNPNFSQLTQEAQSQVKAAFRKMGSLVEEHIEDEECLHYPFYFDASSGKFSVPSVATDFYRSISSTPGKARHEGFHLAVIGRLSKPWIDGTILFIQNCLASRCPPQNIKTMTRIPIPKPDKPDQTRPISIFSFLTDQVSKYLSDGVKATGKLGPEITAYRKNKSVNDITLDQRCTIEGALEFECLLGIIEEDEEKFFDKVTVELQMMVMKTFGFPDQGYCEWNMESMCELGVNITTKYSNIMANFLTGVPQGSTLSVHIANLVMWLKHKIMRGDSKDPTKKRGNPHKFSVWDRGRDK